MSVTVDIVFVQVCVCVLASSQCDASSEMHLITVRSGYDYIHTSDALSFSLTMFQRRTCVTENLWLFWQTEG